METSHPQIHYNELSITSTSYSILFLYLVIKQQLGDGIYQIRFPKNPTVKLRNCSNAAMFDFVLHDMKNALSYRTSIIIFRVESFFFVKMQCTIYDKMMTCKENKYVRVIHVKFVVEA